MFEKIVGQKTSKAIFKTAIDASRTRQTVLGHILLSGPAGVGKTTLAENVAEELGSKCKTLFAPGLKTKDDLTSAVLNLNPKDVLFIDEIHALPQKMAEVLYMPMEVFKIQLCIDTKTLIVDTVPFTLIGATTAPGLVPKPLLSRFKITTRLELYSPEELAEIAGQMADKQNFKVSAEAAMEIARRARGTARLVRNFIDRSIDIAVSRGNSQITGPDAVAAFEMLGIDSNGLNSFERSLLQKLAEQYPGKSVGVETLAALMDEDVESFKRNYEPYLIRQGYLAKTNDGRIITQRGIELAKEETLCSTKGKLTQPAKDM